MSLQYEREVAKGIARAFFVSHWAQKVKDKQNKESSPLFMVGRFEAAHWESLAPTINPPAPYYHNAYKLLGRLEERNEASIDIILRKAMKADGHHFVAPEGYAFEFGKFLGYNCTGRPISWFDTHEMFGLLLVTFDLVIDS
jgi:hypothetical protein